ncbi:MAG: hypothetical protein ACTSWN_07125 [Promethearchaeota archaeon]
MTKNTIVMTHAALPGQAAAEVFFLLFLELRHLFIELLRLQ